MPMNPQVAGLAAKMGGGGPPGAGGAPPPGMGGGGPPGMGGPAPGMGPQGPPGMGGGGDPVQQVQQLMQQVFMIVAEGGPDMLQAVDPVFKGFAAQIKSLFTGGQSPAGPGGGMAAPQAGGPPPGGPMPPQMGP